MALGVLFLALFSDEAVAVAVAVMVLFAVLLSLAPLELPVRRSTLSLAGVVSGLAGTATSIGGPPVALLYQHRTPQMIRSTLAVVFTVGAAMSLVGIWLSGHLDTHALADGRAADAVPGDRRLGRGAAPARAAGPAGAVRRPGDLCGVRPGAAGAQPRLASRASLGP